MCASSTIKLFFQTIWKGRILYRIGQRKFMMFFSYRISYLSWWRGGEKKKWENISQRNRMLCHVTLSLSPLASSFFMKTFDPSFHDFFWLLGGMKKARRNVPMTTSTFLFLVFFATVENSISPFLLTWIASAPKINFLLLSSKSLRWLSRKRKWDIFSRCLAMCTKLPKPQFFPLPVGFHPWKEKKLHR